jgi:lactase-phlorizin hydrolase
VPWGLRKLLVWIKNEYGNPEIIVTENGCSDNGGLEDNQRVEYFRLYINEVLKAVKIDNVNVTGYFAWSLMDVFEWNVGYTEKFGLYSVDFNDPNRTRTPKKSVGALSKIYAENGFPKPKLTASEHSSVGSKDLYCSTAVLSMALIFLVLGLLLAV